MGSLWSKFCLKSSTHEGGHTVLGSNTVGGSGTGSENPNRPDPRAAAAEAAEFRAKQALKKNTQGNLGKQLEAQRGRKPGPEPQEEQRLVWD